MSEMQLLEDEIRPITADEYHRMAEAGILDDEERLELLEGRIVRMRALGTPHWLRHGKIVRYLILQLGDRARVYGESAPRLNELNEPQPDVAILDLAVAVEARQPAWSEIFALIEISDTSLRKDTTVKRRLYARCEVPDYLVVDLNADVLLHFSAPHDGDYPEPRRLYAGETLRLARVPDLDLDAATFLE